MQDIANLPGTRDPFVSTLLVEFERRVSTGTPLAYTSTFYRYTNGVQPFTYISGTGNNDRPVDGSVFLKLPFTLATIVQDAQMGSASEITFDDQSDTIKALALLYNFLDWKVRVWEIGPDANYALLWIKLKISGATAGVVWDVGDENNSATIGIRHGASPVQVLGPREEYGSNCRFLFKSARCGYVGAETVCNRTRTRCVELANQQRFGGFRHAPTPDTRISVGDNGVVQLGSRSALFPQLESESVIG